MAKKDNKKIKSDAIDEKEMPFLDHLEELRWCILKSLAAVGILAVASFYFSTYFLDIMTRPIHQVNPVPKIIFLSPTGMFLVRITLSLVAGVVFGFPFIFYQIWKFVMPGLYEHERRYVIPVIVACTFFFIVGAMVAYFLVIPIALRFLLAMATETIRPTLEIGKYIGFVSRLILAFGIVFQLPIIAYFLTAIGLITPDTMKHYRRYAVIGVFALAAVLTPPDVYSQLLLAFPLLLLYEISILITRIAASQVKRRKQGEEETEEEEAAEREAAEAKEEPEAIPGREETEEPGDDLRDDYNDD